MIYFLNKISDYQLEKIRFYKKMGYKVNLKNPQSYNEKIIWKKIYDRNPLLPITADKYHVRSYIKEVLGEKQADNIFIPLLYVTDKPETIPFENISPPFIIKPNHASGKYIIIKDNCFNKKEIIKTCRRWLKIPFGLKNMEWAYQPIKRKIVIERLLQEKDGSILKDYKFHMFHSKCRLILVDFDLIHHHSQRFFDQKWNPLSVKRPNNILGPKIRKPKNFENMLQIAEKLSEPFDFVRVDFYNLTGKIYIGELTHYPSSGTARFEQPPFAHELGKQWKIQKEYWKL